jgi:hypothetical protein
MQTGGGGLLEQANRTLHIHAFDVGRPNLREVPGGVDKCSYRVSLKLFCYRMPAIQGP